MTKWKYCPACSIRGLKNVLITTQCASAYDGDDQRIKCDTCGYNVDRSTLEKVVESARKFAYQYMIKRLLRPEKCEMPHECGTCTYRDDCPNA